MNTRIILIVATLLTALSCGPKKGSAKVTEPPFSLPDTVLVFDILEPAGEPMMLTSQALTSEGAVMNAFYYNEDEFFSEATPVEKTFFVPEADIKKDNLATLVRWHYNTVNVLNKVVQGYEVFKRLSFGAFEEDSCTYQDTLEWVKATQPGITEKMLKDALQGAPEELIEGARELLAAYRSFDGNDRENSAFYRAFNEYRESYETLPDIATDEELDAFEDTFWDWYDKTRHVPEADYLVRNHVDGYQNFSLNEDQIDRLKRTAMGEKDIDRRAIYALELVLYDRYEGVLLLGDIIESGIYTPYLFEVWTSWRAHAQMEHSPSSFSVIANNYFDMIRVKCINTYLRHCQANPKDEKARIMMLNLILSEIVHRQGSLAGNSSFKTAAELDYWMFINPKLLKEE